MVSLAIAYLQHAIPSFERQQSSGIDLKQSNSPVAKRSSVSHITIKQPALHEVESQKAVSATETEDKFVKYAEEIHYLMHWLVAAYLLFDRSAQGFITKNEMTEIMEEKGHHEGTISFLSTDRWKELDVDKNGDISFAEFCYAFTGWICDSNAEEDE